MKIGVGKVPYSEFNFSLSSSIRETLQGILGKTQQECSRTPGNDDRWRMVGLPPNARPHSGVIFVGGPNGGGVGRISGCAPRPPSARAVTAVPTAGRTESVMIQEADQRNCAACARVVAKVCGSGLQRLLRC